MRQSKKERQRRAWDTNQRSNAACATKTAAATVFSLSQLAHHYICYGSQPHASPNARRGSRHNSKQLNCFAVTCVTVARSCVYEQVTVRFGTNMARQQGRSVASVDTSILTTLNKYAHVNSQYAMPPLLAPRNIHLTT